MLGSSHFLAADESYPRWCSLLVRPHANAPGRPQLVLLDHGLYRALPNDLRMNYARLWQVRTQG